MKYRILLSVILLLSGFCMGAQEKSSFSSVDEAFLQLRQGVKDTRVVMNPVTNSLASDPSAIKIGDDYYLFVTGFPIRIYKSRDLVNWTFYRNMFPGKTHDDPYGTGELDPMKTGVGDGKPSDDPNVRGVGTGQICYWAPSPALIQGKLVVYLTLFVSLENDRQVVCVADDIDSEFRYVNTLNVGTPEHPTPQDGQYFRDDDGKQYLVYGDVNSKGDYIRELSADGLSYAEGSKPYFITEGYEGCYIYKYGGKYYFFGSLGYYNSPAYTIYMCTSDSLLTGWSEPKVVLKSRSDDALLNGAGHNGEIFTDKQGRMFMIMHSHCEGFIPMIGDYHPRMMILMEMKEIDGTLCFVDHKGQPTLNPQWLVNMPDL